MLRLDKCQGNLAVCEKYDKSPLMMAMEGSLTYDTSDSWLMCIFLGIWLSIRIYDVYGNFSHNLYI